MRHVMGGVSFVAALAAMAGAADAQWNPWADNRYSWPPPRAERAPPPARAQPQQPLWWGGGSPFASPQRPASAGPRPDVQYPKELAGGPRPNISPATPPTVNFPNSYGTGSIIIDQGGKALYYVLSSSQAYRYPISVGREGFTWTGTERISRVQAWPDWRPPAEMRERQPGLPELMTGGINNPLGSKALYLGNTLYRIHGTNDARTIGFAASSGCFRMMNQHVEHLASIAGIGTKVMVMNQLPPANRRYADNVVPSPAATSTPPKPVRTAQR
jgi:lipoprotein-anchoring transpeptidase ErfK/SrfK